MYDLENAYHENCSQKKCYHKFLKTYINKFDTMK
jgi:hypothetical protein